jgi:hypothetical protein
MCSRRRLSSRTRRRRCSLWRLPWRRSRPRAAALLRAATENPRKKPLIELLRSSVSQESSFSLNGVDRFHPLTRRRGGNTALYNRNAGLVWWAIGFHRLRGKEYIDPLYLWLYEEMKRFRRIGAAINCSF